VNNRVARGGYSRESFADFWRDSGIFASNVERHDSGPANLDKTADEYYAPEVTDDQVDAADSMFGVAP
jgi:hypothetical protein